MANKGIYHLSPSEEEDFELLLQAQFEAEAKVSAFVRFLLARRGLSPGAFINVSTMTVQLPSPNPNQSAAGPSTSPQ